MKKIISILVLALVLGFTSCKKNNKTLNPASQDVYCIFITNYGPNGNQRHFYKCVDNVNDYQNENIYLRNNNYFHEDVKKSDCSECQ